MKGLRFNYDYWPWQLWRSWDSQTSPRLSSVGVTTLHDPIAPAPNHVRPKQRFFEKHFWSSSCYQWPPFLADSDDDSIQQLLSIRSPSTRTPFGNAPHTHPLECGFFLSCRSTRRCWTQPHRVERNTLSSPRRSRHTRPPSSGLQLSTCEVSPDVLSVSSLLRTTSLRILTHWHLEVLCRGE